MDDDKTRAQKKSSCSAPASTASVPRCATPSATATRRATTANEITNRAHPNCRGDLNLMSDQAVRASPR